MAAKNARAEKSVLNRQEVTSRKRAIQEQKLTTHGAGRRALGAVFTLAGSLLALLSLATWDLRDRVGPGFRNAIGPAGHQLAELLRGFVGQLAYALPALGLYATFVLLNARPRRRWPTWLSALVLVTGAAVLAQLFFGDRAGLPHAPGGAVGFTLARVLAGTFSTVGTVILVSALSVAALLVGTNFLLLKVFAWTWAGISGLLGSGARLGKALWARQWKALQAAREVAAKKKLEEAAFLAQLEADAEELAQMEREMVEADAIAAEAEFFAEPAPPPPAEKPLVATPPATLVAPVERLPGQDPAWALTLHAPPPAAPAERKRERKPPQIVTPPSQVAETPVLQRPLVLDMNLSLPPTVPVEPAPQALPAAAEEKPQAQATQKVPLIVEPKAPPKPTKKRDTESFQFLGDRTSFTLPPQDLLTVEKHERSALDKQAFLTTAEKLTAKLADFGIVGEVVEIRPGPVVTMYEFLPGPGIKVSKIAALADDLAMAMEAMRVRIVAPIPGKGVVGIEVPNKDREMVYLKEIAEQDAFTKSASKLAMCVGKDIEGMPYVLDLAKAPHLLIAGTTGSGKSVAVNGMIMSILLKSTPEEVRFIMVDPKMLELSVYEGIPQLLLPVVTDPKKATMALRWAVEEMERRYHLLSEAGVKNIAGYNKLVESSRGQTKALLKVAEASSEKQAAPAADPAKSGKKRFIIDVANGESEEEALARASSGETVGVPAPFENAPEEVREPPGTTEMEAKETSPAGGEAEAKEELRKLPYLVVIIDELADLMMVASREVETYIARLAQMARAAGIHLMVATQRPSTDVVTGVIKANFPTRISFMLRSKPDSMTIFGATGAEALLGMGDMLIMPPTSAHLVRVHGAYVSEAEIKAVVDHLKAQGKPVYDESILKPREEDLEAQDGEDELSDELYDQALAVVSEMRQVSISMLQRKMRIGYNRAARMIERMERDGVVGAADGAKPRDVLIRPVGEMPGAGAMS